MRRKCKDCISKWSEEKDTGGRCRSCYCKMRTAAAARQRKKRREEQRKNNKQLKKEGRQICSRCLGRKRLSEFGTSLDQRKGKLNQICDRCLTTMYSALDKSWYAYFRRRAYSINSACRQREARNLRVKISEVSLSDLDHVCKPQDLAKIYEKQKGVCKYCGTVLRKNYFTLDHANPLSRGGKHTLTNLVMCCPDCNRLKHTRNTAEFVKFLKDYLSRLI